MSAFLVLFHGELSAQPLTGTKTVCSSGCDYTSLSGTAGLFNDINTNGLGSNLTVTINSDLAETGDVGLNNITIGAANTIVIKPAAAVLYTISGSIISTVAPVGLIKLNGADNVTIDGRFAGNGKYLLFRNASAVTSGSSTQPVLNFTNSAINNVVTNCIIESNAANGGRAPVMVNNTGSNNLTIDGCEIRNSTGTVTGNPNTAISSTGTGNTVQILNNNIYNFTQFGVSLSGTAGGCTVSGNSFYSTLTNVNSSVTAIYISSNGGHTVSNNYIGGSGPLCAGTWTNAADQNFTGIQMNNSAPNASSIQGNTLQNINLSNLGGFNSSCVLIDLGTGSYNVGTVTGNTLGHATTPNSILVATEGATGTIGIRCNGSSGMVNLSNNTIANMKTTSTLYGIMRIRGIEHSGGSELSVSNNDIHSLLNANSTIDAVTGIYSSGIGIATSWKIFNGNKIYDLETSDATTATTITAILITAGLSMVERNRIYDLRSPSPNGFLAGISMSGGDQTLLHNQISITNNANGNSITIDGAISTGSNAIMAYNSIYIAGAASSGAANSYAFRRTGTGATIANNNLLYNGRTGGTGRHYAIGNTNAAPATGWGANVSNYNLLVSTAAAYVGEWGSGSNKDFVNWKTSSSGDGNSWSTDASAVPALNLFADPNNGNLNINTANPEAWYVNGRGVQIAGVTADYGNPLAGRSTTVPGGAPDIGSDEMVPTSVPPAPTVTGTIGVGNTQTFTFAGRTLGSLQWTAGTALPTGMTWVYRPGTNPPNNLNNHYANAYWTIEPVGGSNYTYTLNLNYDPATLGTAVENSLRIAKKPQASTTWTDLSTSTVNTTTKVVTAAAQTSFSDFTLTDNISPLPVKLASFTANAKGDLVNVEWVTANEKDMDNYGLERSVNGTHYDAIATIKAKGNTTYTYQDGNAVPGVNYYRLRMNENSGAVTYSNTVIALMDQSGVRVFIYPNPAKDILNVSLSKTITDPVKLEITDMTGRIVYSTVVKDSEIGIDLKNLAAGTYQLQYGDDRQKQMIRFIKN
ncbi:MAG TPA: T9SS type A sorting domain-containing protein [Flavipsychrobacter sp.]|nr:T9SS type A sorting domain-containing protein [Flavipsychrobacter sp.]